MRDREEAARDDRVREARDQLACLRARQPVQDAGQQDADRYVQVEVGCGALQDRCGIAEGRLHDRARTGRSVGGQGPGMC
ncbi:hypothetical protein BJF79_02350 [Actinomadura sp. CNU-125]|nr:hypothetical protein BJF79_02350 [Actinomadura sp. CNU-125]